MGSWEYLSNFCYNLAIDGYEWMSFNLKKSAAFPLHASENNLKPP